MQVSKSVKFAGLLLVAVFVYFLAREIFRGDGDAGDTIDRARFAVVAETFEPQDWRAEIIVRGRTAADRKVVIRAETAGAVAATPATEGSAVKEGDVICRIEVNARQAQLAEARASLAKARLDYDAAVKLNKEGFRSDTGVAAAKAALDLALANVERTEVELSKTDVKAPFDGVLDHRTVEVGDYMKVGDPCGTVIQQNPFLIVGAVAEKDVAKISLGDRGVARLATGETLEGEVHFIASAAEPATRTFDVELIVPNEDGHLRDGVTAEFTIFAKERLAHLIPRSSLTLADDGSVGVRMVSNEGEVSFAKLVLLGESPDGVWVDGLEGDARVIVRGQEYVSPGQKVDVVDAATMSSGGQSEAAQ